MSVGGSSPTPPSRGRVVFVCNSLRIGGSQTVLLELVRTAVSAGFEAIVASRGGELAPRFADAGARVTRLPVRGGAAGGNTFRPVSVFKTSVSMIGLLQLSALCSRKRTVLHASQPWPVAIASGASKLTGKPLIWHAHGTTSVEMPPAWISTVRATSVAWVGITPEVQRALLDLRPAPRTQVLGIPNPIRIPAPAEIVDCARRPNRSERVVIGVMSTLTANKRDYVESCLRAASDVASDGRECQVRVVGDGPEKSYLQEAAQAIKTREPGLTVSFLGSSLDPWPLLVDCDAIIGMGLVALEAAARRHMVVCASSEGIGGILSLSSYAALHDTNLTGRSVSPLSVPALAQVMRASLEAEPDPGLSPFICSRHGTEARDQWVSLWDSAL